VNRALVAFDDRIAVVRRLRQQVAYGRNSSTSGTVAWLFDHVFLTGDSAGATIAFHIAAWLGEGQLGGLALWRSGPVLLQGSHEPMIQPFFSGETRTALEKTLRSCRNQR
jgi:acetyl esterase/lipase